MKSVVVTWVDAISDDDWTDIEKAKGLMPPTMTTLGYLLYEDELRVVIAASHDAENEKVASIYSIPMSWVLDIKDIEI